MSKRLLAAGALSAAALGVTLTAGVGAAQAATSAPAATAQTATGVVEYGQYYYMDECEQIGSQVVQSGKYQYFTCDWQPFDPGYTGSGVLGIATLYVWDN